MFKVSTEPCQTNSNTITVSHVFNVSLVFRLFSKNHTWDLEKMRGYVGYWHRRPPLADPAVGFGGGQLGEVTQARVPPKLKTPRIWPTIFWGVAPKSRTKIKYIKRKTKKKVRLQVLAHHGSPWLVRWDPDSF